MIRDNTMALLKKQFWQFWWVYLVFFHSLTNWWPRLSVCVYVCLNVSVRDSIWYGNSHSFSHLITWRNCITYLDCVNYIPYKDTSYECRHMNIELFWSRTKACKEEEEISHITAEEPGFCGWSFLNILSAVVLTMLHT